MNAALENVAAAFVAGLGASALKATAILLAACAVVGLRRTASAAQRHTIWLAALIACAMTTIASPWLPELSIRLDASPRVAAAARALGVATGGDARIGDSGNAGSSVRSAHTTGLRAYGGEPASALPASTSNTSHAGRSSMLIACLWTIGAFVLALRLILGTLILLRTARRLRTVDDPIWIAELREAERAFGAARQVRLVWSAAGTMPLTFGVRRPIVAIPATASDWSAAERRAVVLHELAHVVRGDVRAQIFGDAIWALLWFHPLLWIARHRLRAEAERAADDRVLGAGISATVYATQLLGLARDNCGHRVVAPASAALFANSDIEGRFTAMLDMRRSRSSSSAKARNAAGFLACVVGAVLAALRVVTPAAAQVPILTFAVPRLAPTPARSAPAAIAQVVTNASTPSPALQVEFTIPRAVPETNIVGPSPAPAVAVAEPVSSPDLSGTWIADTMYMMGRSIPVPARIVILISQTPSTIHFVRRGQMPMAVGNAKTDSVEFQSVVPLDGSSGTATLNFAGNSYGASVSAAWKSDTLVTTTKGVWSGLPWAQVERWSLESDGSLRLEAKATERSAPVDSSSGYFQFRVQNASMKLSKVP